jgi:hypothetical protein
MGLRKISVVPLTRLETFERRTGRFVARRTGRMNGTPW